MQETQLTTISSAAIDGESHTLDRGAIIYSHRGIASVRINFDHWDMQGESVLIMFPGDVIKWEMMDDDFSADAIMRGCRHSSTVCASRLHGSGSRKPRSPAERA